MKHSISTLLFLFLFVTMSCYSQSQEKTISITFTDITLSEAIRKIEGISIYTFFYDAILIDMNQKVSLKANKLPVNLAIKQLLLNSTVQFEISNTQIALIQSEAIKSTPTKITGIVIDENGEPLIGATIKLKDTNIGTTTSLLGNFSLENTTNASVIVVSYIGYATNEYRITNKSDLKIVLQEDAKSLSEVVVIGYGESSRRDLTGSIVKITGNSIANRPNSNAVSSLQGKVPGLSIVNTGQMNQAPDVRIRGTVSLSKTSPLYVVDGIMSETMDMVNTSEIESMEVLKDPSSLAIFGVRGANGVIIVTTKKGKSGRLIINANSSVGLKSIADAPRMTDREGFITLYNEQRFNNSLPLYQKYELYNANTNWIDVIKEPSPTVYKANVSVSHGTDKNKFYMGINVNKEKGLIQYEDFQKIGMSVSNELNPVSFLKIGFGLNGYAASLPQYHDFTTALKSPPIVEPYNFTEAAYNSLPQGLGSNDIENPLFTVEGKKFTSIATEYAFVPNFFVELKLLEKFTFRTNYYFNLYTKHQRDYTPLSQIYNLEIAELEVKNDKTAVSQFSNLDLRFQQEYLLTFRDAFQNHNLTVLTGVTSDYQYYTLGKTKKLRS
jgi:TonB-linked SusC/RagA family outer membrane protein